MGWPLGPVVKVRPLNIRAEKVGLTLIVLNYIIFIFSSS